MILSVESGILIQRKHGHIYYIVNSSTMESFKVLYSLSQQRSRTRINIAVEKQSKAVIFLTIPLILRRSISVTPFSFMFKLSLKTMNKASKFRKSRWINLNGDTQSN